MKVHSTLKQYQKRWWIYAAHQCHFIAILKQADRQTEMGQCEHKMILEITGIIPANHLHFLLGPSAEQQLTKIQRKTAKISLCAIVLKTNKKPQQPTKTHYVFFDYIQAGKKLSRLLQTSLCKP